MSVRANTECGRDMEGQLLTNCVFGCLEAIRIDLRLYKAMFVNCALKRAAFGTKSLTLSLFDTQNEHNR